MYSRIVASTCEHLVCRVLVHKLICRRDSTINYQGRQHDIDFVLNPYYSAANLTFNQSLLTLNVTYKRTLLYEDRFGVKTSGLDPLGVRAAELGYPLVALADPVVPIPNSSFSHLSMDNEGLVLNADGTSVAHNTLAICASR